MTSLRSICWGRFRAPRTNQCSDLWSIFLGGPSAVISSVHNRILVLEHGETVRSTGMKITRAKISGHCLVTVARPFSMPFGAFWRTLRGCLFR